MARRRSATPKAFEKYPGVYARTSDTWTTRYYQRKGDPVFDMLGLYTANDDFHKKVGSSPFLRNVRYLGERDADQRAQTMSRKGAKFMNTIGEETFARQISEGDVYLTIYEGKAIEFQMDHSKLLTGLFFYLYNEGKATGCVRITIRNLETKQELINAVIDTADLSQSQYLQHYVRLIKTVKETRVLIRMEIMDDVGNDEDRSDTRTKRAVRVLSKQGGVHQYATYSLPNTNESLEEIPYEFSDGAGIPLTGVTINDWEPMVRGIEVVSGGQKHIVFPVRRDDTVEIYRVNEITREIVLVTNNVDARAEAVRFAIAEGYLYYVDGYSALKRINLTDWSVANVVPLPSEITISGVTPAQLTAKAGASLIHYLNNRLYLSGFKDDPNLVIVSLIDDVKPRFEQYNDRFYSPDQSPQLSAGSPITALADISDYLIVFRVDGQSMYDYGAGTSASSSQQQTPEGAQLGVLNQEAVAQGKNNIYFYNPIEGVQRFGGSVNRGVSGDIENLIAQIQHPENVFLIFQDNRLRMYFSFTEEQPDSCFYYYADLEGQLPWYLDNNTPVSSAIPAKDSKTIFAIHSQVPTVMEVESEFKDFDSFVIMEYNTQYRLPPTADPAGESIIRNLHLEELVDSDHAVFMGLDIDHQDKPAVWRRFVEGQQDDTPNPDAIFEQSAEAGTTVIHIPTYIRCKTYQARLKRFCYKDRAEIIGLVVEYGTKDPI